MLNLAYAKPANRLEQIIYQDLALRLGASDLPTAPLASLAVWHRCRRNGPVADRRPAKPIEITVTATLTITPRDGSAEPPVRITRRATANFTRDEQVLADQEAQTDAAERAAGAVAESLRLAVLASLMR